MVASIERRRSESLMPAFRVDDLPELAGAQEADEARRQEDADEQRRRAGDEDFAHQAGSSALATTSSPTPREAFSSTVSPGSSSPGRIAAAACASGTATT